MNTLKRKYSCENAIIAGEMTNGVSLEKLVTKLTDDCEGNYHQACNGRSSKPDSRHSDGTALTRSISMLTPHSISKVQGRGRSSTILFPNRLRGLRKHHRKDKPATCPDTEDVHRRNISAENLLSPVSCNFDGVSNRGLLDTGSSILEIAQSLIHIPAGSTAFSELTATTTTSSSSIACKQNIVSMARHSSTSNIEVSESEVRGDQYKPLGTLQRLARSSSNLISRSKSCLTLESLQRFRKNFTRSEKEKTEKSNVVGKRILTSTTELNPDLGNREWSSNKLSSRSSSLISVDFEHSENYTDRMNSPVDEPITTSSNLTLSSTSRVDAALVPMEVTSNGNCNASNLCRLDGVPQSQSLLNTSLQPVSVTNDVSVNVDRKHGFTAAQRSKSFHSDGTDKKSLRRNPSMLYYFNKTPLRLKFRKESCSHNEGTPSDEIQSGNSADSSLISHQNDTCNNHTGEQVTKQTTYKTSLSLDSSYLCSKAVCNSPVSRSSAYYIQEIPEGKYSDLKVFHTADANSIDSSHFYEPGQFHGPEFVLRSRLPVKQLSLVPDKSNQPQQWRGVRVVLVCGQQLLVRCSPSSSCIAHLAQCVSVECGVSVAFHTLFGLALLQDGEFFFPPPHTKLAKLAPKGWRNKKAAKDPGFDSFTLHYRLACYPSMDTPTCSSLCRLVYLQTRQDALQGRMHTSSPQQHLYLAALALRAEMTDWLMLYQDAKHHLLKYYLPEHLLSKLQEESCSDEQIDTTEAVAPADVIPELVLPDGLPDPSTTSSSSLLHDADPSTPYTSRMTRTSPESSSCINSDGSTAPRCTGAATAASDESAAGSNGACLSGAEILRVLVSYEGKLRTVSAWGAVRRFLGTAQRIAHYGAHYYALRQHPQCPAPPHYLGVSCGGLLLLPQGPPSSGTVSRATVHAWVDVKDIRRWSDGRVRVVVQCQQCADGGATRRRGPGLGSCVGSMGSDATGSGGPAASTTHKITLRTGSGIKSKCLSHLMKLHKKISLEPLQLTATTSFLVTTDDMSTSCSSWSLPSLGPLPLTGVVNLQAVSSPSFPQDTVLPSSTAWLPSSTGAPAAVLSPAVHVADAKRTVSDTSSSELRNEDVPNNASYNTLLSSEFIDEKPNVSQTASAIKSVSPSESSLCNGLPGVPSYETIITPIKLPNFTCCSSPAAPTSLQSEFYHTPSFKSDFAKRLSASSSSLDPQSDISSVAKRVLQFDNESEVGDTSVEDAAIASHVDIHVTHSLGEKLSSDLSNLDITVPDVLGNKIGNNLELDQNVANAFKINTNIMTSSSSLDKLSHLAPAGSSLVQTTEASEFLPGREDLSDILLMSCLKFSEICTNLVETSNQKLKQFLSDDGNAPDGNFSFNTSFDKMFDTVIDEECDAEGYETGDSNSASCKLNGDSFDKRSKIVKFDLNSDVMNFPIVEENSSNQNTNGEDNVTCRGVEESSTDPYERVPRVIGKMCVDEMDVGFLLGEADDASESGGTVLRRETKDKLSRLASESLGIDRVDSGFGDFRQTEESQHLFRKTRFDVIPEGEEVSSNVALQAGSLSSSSVRAPRPTTLPLFSDISKKEFNLHSPNRGKNNLLARRTASHRDNVAGTGFYNKPCVKSPLKLSPFQANNQIINAGESSGSSVAGFVCKIDSLSVGTSENVERQLRSHSLDSFEIMNCQSKSNPEDNEHLSFNESQGQTSVNVKSISEGSSTLTKMITVCDKGNQTSQSTHSNLPSNLTSPTNAFTPVCALPCAAYTSVVSSKCKEAPQPLPSTTPSVRIPPFDDLSFVLKEVTLPSSPCLNVVRGGDSLTASSDFSKFLSINSLCKTSDSYVDIDKLAVCTATQITARTEAATTSYTSASTESGSGSAPVFNRDALARSWSPPPPASPCFSPLIPSLLATPSPSSSRRAGFSSSSSGRGCNSPCQLGVTSICGSPLRRGRSISASACLDDSGASRSQHGSPHMAVSPSVRMGTRLSSEAVARQRIRSERMKAACVRNPSERPLASSSSETPPYTGFSSSGESLDSLTEEDTPHKRKGGALRHAGAAVDSDDVSMDSFQGCVLVPVVVTRGAGGCLGIVVVQGGQEDDDDSDTDEEYAADTSADEPTKFREQYRHETSADSDASSPRDTLFKSHPLEHEEGVAYSSDDGITGVGEACDRLADRSVVVVVQTVLEGGPAYNKLIPGDQLVWVNGHNLEELPYHSSVDLLRDSSIPVLSFVVVRQRSDHQLLLQRQRRTANVTDQPQAPGEPLARDCATAGRSQQQRHYHKFDNEQSPEEYYRDMHKQQLKQRRVRESTAKYGAKSSTTSDLSNIGVMQGTRLPLVPNGTVNDSSSCTSARISQSKSSLFSLCDRCSRLSDSLPGDYRENFIPCDKCESLRVKLKVEYFRSNRSVNTPVVGEQLQQNAASSTLPITPLGNEVNKGITKTKLQIAVSNEEKESVPKYTCIRTIKLARSESRGEIREHRTVARPRSAVQRSHTFSGRALRDEVRSGRVTCVTLNADDASVTR